MRIIPVIDLKRGRVVHAVAGRRDKYMPIESKIASSSLPVEVARSLRNEFQFRELYVADLDAIERKGSNLADVNRLRSDGWQVYLDAGTSSVKDLRRGIRDVDRLVVGTETLGSLSDLREVCKVHPWVVASLDMMFGRIWSHNPEIADMDMPEVVSALSRTGVSEIIFLEVSRVGTGSGVNEQAVRMALRASTVPMLVGGGIRNVYDIERLERMGVSGVLVATALHTGRLRREDLEKFAERRS